MPPDQDTAITTTTDTTTTTAADPWYKTAGADAETVGYLQNRGLHDKSVQDVALAAIKAHREAERHLGVPATQLLRIPTEGAPEAEFKAYYARLGVPDDATGYDFTAVKGANDAAINPALADAIRAAALGAHLPKDGAVAVASAVVKALDAQSASAATEKQAQLTEAKARLAANWGANAEGNKYVATQAAKAFGIDEETVNAMEGVMGYDKVMEFLRSVGSKIGEDKFVTSQTTGGSKTYEQSLEEKKQLMADTSFTKRLMDGDAEAVRQMTALNTLIASGRESR